MTRELVRYDPLEMTPFGATFGRLFDEVWGRPGFFDGDRALSPALDVVEDEDSITVSVELPGLKKEDVNVQVENGVLTISGEKKTETEKKDRQWHRMERRYGAFCRTLSLPRGVVADGAEAKFADGVLSIRLPKREDVKPKAVRIQ